MIRIIKHRSQKAGLPPGSLEYVGKGLEEKVTLSIIDYNQTQINEKSDATLTECHTCLQNETNTWIHITGVHDVTTIRKIGDIFQLHPLVLEDILHTGQRPKLDDYKDSLYVVLRLLKMNQIHQELEDEQISFILGKNFIITFFETNTDIFEPIRERLRKDKSRIRVRGADYLFYALIDCVVDHSYLILEKVDGKLELLEEQLINQPIPETLLNIQRVKRSIIFLRKNIWPIREVINLLQKIESPLIKDETRIYLHDVYDHIIQSIDTIESFRDIAGGMLDIYLSNLSQRMNEVMKVLTVVATLFVPLTFIASIYGMNFKHMPELDWEWGYPLTLSLMGVIALAMLSVFKWKKWF